MTAKSLRMAAINAIQLNAQLQPPDREMRQLAGAVVTNSEPLSVPIAIRKPCVAKRPLKPRPHAAFTRRHDATTSRRVDCTRRPRSADRTGSDRAMRNHPLKCHSPDVIRLPRRRQRLRLTARHTAGDAAADSRLPSAINSPIVLAAGHVSSDVAHRGSRAASSATNADACPQHQNRVAESERPSPVRAPSVPASRSPAPPPDPRRQRSTHLSGGFTTDLIALRQLRHRPLVSQPLRNKRQTLIHGARLRTKAFVQSGRLPGEISHPCIRSTVLPLYPVRTGGSSDELRTVGFSSRVTTRSSQDSTDALLDGSGQPEVVSARRVRDAVQACSSGQKRSQMEFTVEALPDPARLPWRG